MKLDDFANKLVGHVEAFRKYWEAGEQDDFPSEMPEDEWEDQFLSFIDLEHGEKNV